MIFSKFLKAFLLGVLFVFFAPQIALAADYFVSISGNDSNPGSASQPWRTIQKAANVVNGGDTVTVSAGDYAERITISRSGSSGNQITFQAQGTVYTKGFNVLANYITVQGFNATSNNTNWRDGWAIFVNGSHDNILNNFVYYSNGGIDIFHPPTQTTPTDSNLIKGNRVFRNRGRNIELEGTNSIVENNEIWAALNPAIDPPGSISGDLGDSDGIHFHGSNHIIRFNNIHNMTYSDPQMSTGHMDCMQTWQDTYHEAASNILIEKNICDLPTYNSCCIAHSFMLSEGNNFTIKNNLLRTIGGVNQGNEGPNSNVSIYNNTFVSALNTSSAMYNTGVTTTGSTNYFVRNNIFYNFEDPVIYLNGYDGAALGHVYTNNIAYNSTGSPTVSWCMGGCRVIDPKFVSSSSNFHLQSISPAVDTGVTLASVTDDFDGVARPQGVGYDIGAFEYKSGVIPPTPTPAPTPTPTPVPTAAPVSGDANGDYKVDELDYSIWLNHYNQNLTGVTNGDFNADTKVDGVDYVIWLNAFVASATGASGVNKTAWQSIGVNSHD